MHKRRRWSDSGPQPVPYVELQSYVGMKFRLPPEQIRRLLLFTEALDDAYLADFAKKQQDKQGASN